VRAAAASEGGMGFHVDDGVEEAPGLVLCAATAAGASAATAGAAFRTLSLRAGGAGSSGSGGGAEASACSRALSVRLVECNDTLDGPEAVDAKSGALVWEGGLDLARHIAALPTEERSTPSSSSSAGCRRCIARGARVLELGAGHGVPGIVAALCHGASVDFHDRAADVLRRVTSTNVVANGLSMSLAPSDPSAEGCRFLAGDWRQLSAAVDDLGLRYDVVLAAEAIYRTDMYEDLAAVLEQCLAHGGLAFFAGKRFYFGCGGGTASFASFLQGRGFAVSVDLPIEDGKSNVREVLFIERAGAEQQSSKEADKEAAARSDDGDGPESDASGRPAKVARTS